jgi:acyl carrier protein
MNPDKVTYQNGEAPETVSPQLPSQQDSVPRFEPQHKDDFLVKIAMKLNDPKIIHEVISSFDRVRPEITVPFVAPSSPVEKEIASFWTELLGFEQIGVNDDFFDLGGHSLLAMQVLSRIRASFGVELSPRLLVTQDFTIAALSKAIVMEQIRLADTSELDNILDELDILSIDELRKLNGLDDKE